MRRLRRRSLRHRTRKVPAHPSSLLRAACALATLLAVIAVRGAPAAAEVQIVQKEFYSPDFVPPARPLTFSEELFRDTLVHRGSPPPPLERPGVVEYSMTLQPCEASLFERFSTAQDLTYLLGALTETVPHRQEYAQSRTGLTATHRLGFGPARERGPRVEVSYGEAGDGTETERASTWSDPAAPRDGAVAFRSSGYRRRWGLQLSWPLREWTFHGHVQRFRLWGGWQAREDRYDLSDRQVSLKNGVPMALGTPGPAGTSRIDGEGPTVGASGRWSMDRRSELFLEVGGTLVDFSGSRQGRTAAAPSLTFEGSGVGWDGRLGVRWTFGRAFAEAAVGGYRFAGGGGTAHAEVPAAGFAFDLKTERLEQDDLGASVTLGWRF